MIQKAKIKNIAHNGSWLAPYAGETVFIINEEILILDDEIYEDFYFEEYEEFLEIIQTVDN
mgnify:CR=1 FL=1